ncbi:hypothetical protein DOY81_009281 [Sarcophaga bullata]|nr:hypothetical protein DOY81_009281 [Sarcophaga bullata]
MKINFEESGVYFFNKISNKIVLRKSSKKKNIVTLRIMSNNDLPPLPKSLSGINKMLASEFGLVSRC